MLSLGLETQNSVVSSGRLRAWYKKNGRWSLSSQTLTGHSSSSKQKLIYISVITRVEFSHHEDCKLHALSAKIRCEIKTVTTGRSQFQIAVFLACLACAVASPQAYSHPALKSAGYGGYEAPAVKTTGYGGYEAPAVKTAGYGGYEAPAVKTAAYEAPVLKTAAYETPVLVKAAPVIPIVRFLKEDDNYGNYNLQ